MSFYCRQLDPKSRRIFAAGNLCLWSAVLLTRCFEHSFGLEHPVLFEGLRFPLIGCALTLLIVTLRRGVRCNARSQEELQ